MAHGRWILSLQQGSAAAAGFRVVLHHLIHPLDRQQLRPRSRMVRLTAALAATVLAPLRRLKPRAVTGGRLGRVARAAADPLPQAGQFGRQGGELRTELLVLLSESLNLLLLSEDQRSDAGWCCQPIRFWDPGRSVLITGGLCLRCNQESSCRQGFSRAEVRGEPSRPLNGYNFLGPGLP
jgi:hypothetical protein